MKPLLLILSVFIGIMVIQPSMGFAEENVKVIVKYKDNTNNVKMGTLSDENKSIPIDFISVEEGKVAETIRALNNDPNIEYVEVDKKIYTQAQPDDSLYANQMQMYEAIHAEEAWAAYTPKQEVTVAVIDSGIELNHPDLIANLVDGVNILDRSKSPNDTHGHGTHVAGLIGAETNNNLGVSSLSQGTKLMPIKVLENNEGLISDVILGIEYAIKHDVDIINISLGTTTDSRALRETIDYATKENILVVAAAGNANNNRFVYPAAYPSVLAVGSIDMTTNDKAPFSNYGPYLSVVAPGSNILSTWLDGSYHSLDGTSMSTGVVTALAALVMKDTPYLTAQQVKSIIEDAAAPVSSSYDLGHGLINAIQSLDTVETYHRLKGPTSVETSIEIAKYGWTALPDKSITIDGEEIVGRFVIIATANKFPDSLAASPLASFLDSPILLVKHQQLPTLIKDELNRLQPTNVIFIGGENAVSKQIETEVQSLGYGTHRLNGSDRYETAIAVNRTIPYQTDKAFVVSGERFPDALSVAAYSGIHGYPILYVRQNSIPQVVTQYMEEKGISETYIIGGPTPVSPHVENQLPAPYRVAGENRYQTNRAVHGIFGMDSADMYYFSTGQNYPDALAVAPLAVKTKSPVILAHPNMLSQVRESIELFPKGNNYRITGGPNAIGVELGWQIDQFTRE